MKPDPYLVVEALRLVKVRREDGVLVGDSISDVMAGMAAGVPVIGLAKTPRRGRDLEIAGARALLVRHEEST